MGPVASLDHKMRPARLLVVTLLSGLAPDIFVTLPLPDLVFFQRIRGWTLDQGGQNNGKGHVLSEALGPYWPPFVLERSSGMCPHAQR